MLGCILQHVKVPWWLIATWRGCGATMLCGVAAFAFQRPFSEKWLMTLSMLHNVMMPQFLQCRRLFGMQPAPDTGGLRHISKSIHRCSRRGHLGSRCLTSLLWSPRQLHHSAARCILQYAVHTVLRHLPGTRHGGVKSFLNVTTTSGSLMPGLTRVKRRSFWSFSTGTRARSPAHGQRATFRRGWTRTLKTMVMFLLGTGMALVCAERPTSGAKNLILQWCTRTRSMMPSRTALDTATLHGSARLMTQR